MSWAEFISSKAKEVNMIPTCQNAGWLSIHVLHFISSYLVTAESSTIKTLQVQKR